MTPRIFVLFVTVFLFVGSGCTDKQPNPTASPTEIPTDQSIAQQSTVMTETLETSMVGAQFEFRCENVDEIPLAECEALVALYEANPNADMFEQWLTNHEPCFEWQHVTCRDGHVAELDLEPNPWNNYQAKVYRYDPGITTMPPEIGNFKSLTKLDLSYNEFTELPPEIGELESLQILIFARNDLLTTLPPEIGNLSALEELILGGSTALVELPPEIGSLYTLKKLSIGLSDIAELPNEIGKLSELEHLSLVSNHSLTSLPPEFGNLSKLSILHLIDNRLTSLPDTFGNLSSLQCLQIDQREIEFLPADLSNLSEEIQSSLETHQKGNSPSMVCPF